MIIRNSGFSAHNQFSSANTIKKSQQIKRGEFISKNNSQNNLPFGIFGMLFRQKPENTVKHIIKTADDLLHNIKLDVREDGHVYTISGRLTRQSIERSLDTVKKLLKDKKVKADLTDLLDKNKRPDNAAQAVTDMINRLTGSNIKLS